MIKKIEGFKNGYDLSQATSEDWAKLVNGRKIETIYMNKETRKHFRQGLLSNNRITITNKLLDMIIYFNAMC